MNLRFDRPEFLWLLGLLVPLVLVGWSFLGGMDALRRTTALLLRTLFFSSLIIVLAAPRSVREHDAITVVGVLDISGSVKRFANMPYAQSLDAPGAIEYLRWWFREATNERAPDDRFGLVVFDGQSAAISTPRLQPMLDETIDLSMADGTNIADAIELALAMLPGDTARRIVLVSDGAQTQGDALDVARRAAGRIVGQRAVQDVSPSAVPIDVLPIAYAIDRDVQIAAVEAPLTAQPEQTISVRIVLEATTDVPGRLSLLHEGVPVDLNGDLPGFARTIIAQQGQTYVLANVKLGSKPVNRFEAVFEPEEPMLDRVPDNNMGSAVTATPSRGRSLLITAEEQASDTHALHRALTEAGVTVELRPASRAPTDLLDWQAYDLVMIDNVPSYFLQDYQQQLLREYVEELGGGLIMVGGEHAFGPGAWNETAIEEILPLELDPPLEFRAPSAALVIVLDRSGSMSRRVAGSGGRSQQQIANEAAVLAVQSLRSDTLVGVVSFSGGATVEVPLQRNSKKQLITEKIRAIEADGSTHISSGLQLAHDMLSNVDAERKRIVCLTDGQSPDPDLEPLVDAMTADDIKLSTIAIGNEADHNRLRKLAEVGGGEFYPVYNPRRLPRVLVDSVEIINKPLIKEATFRPSITPSASTLAVELSRAPELDGLVITAIKPDAQVTLEAVDPEGDPLLAHWQAGLGKVAAFTSDAHGLWSQRWLSWSGYGSFWAQLVRAMSRPPIDPDSELSMRIEDGELIIEFVAGDENEATEFLTVDGKVYTPGQEVIPIRMKQKSARLFEYSLPARESGAYVIAITPRQGQRRLTPVVGGVTQSGGEEFRRYSSNIALLKKIAETTGGRVLPIESPGEAKLFDRENMPSTVSLLPVWRDVLWLALVLLMLDVASRRIAWSAEGMRTAAARMAQRVVPSRVKGGRAAQTLASLRESSSRPQQQDTTTSGVKRETQRPQPQTSKKVQAPPDRAKVAEALVALRSGIAPPSSDRERSDQKQDKHVPSDATTSGLLAAKRRLREQIERDDAHEGDTST